MINNPIGTLSLSKREILRFVSVANQTLFPPLVSSAFFIYMWGVAIGSRVDLSSTGLSYLQFILPGLMTIHLISSSYENTSSSLFIARWHNHIQEVLLSPLSYFEMVLGLLAGGVTRGIIVCVGVYIVALFFTPLPLIPPFLLSFFILTIAVIFSCGGMMGALWAEDFGMLSLWSIYIIIPLVMMGGVFHPMAMLPDIIRHISKFNPMHYLVDGMRYSVTGVSDSSILICALISFILALGTFFATVYMFRIGYKLRT